MVWRGVWVGFMGGKRDWKTVVERFSRFLGTAGSFFEAPLVESAGSLVVKLFMTKSGGARYSPCTELRGRFCVFSTSLQRLYASTRKCSVGPRGVTARRMFTFPLPVPLVFSLREKRTRCVTPRGPAMVV